MCLSCHFGRKFGSLKKRIMASKRITQETFDAVVKENIEEFEMSPEEALREAIEQFESQGVNLVNILKTVPAVGGEGDVAHAARHPVLEALDQLHQVLQGVVTDKESVKASLTKFSLECGVDISHRIAAASNNAYPTLKFLVQKYLKDEGMLLAALDGMAALLNGQPDLIQGADGQMLCDILRENVTSEKIAASCIRTIRLTCTMHEINRRAFVKAELIPLLIQTLENCPTAAAIKEACGALRILTVDDDIRVPFGKAHDHAKMIVEAGAMKVILDTLTAHVDDPSLAGDLCLTLSRLAVRNEFCQEIVDLGGLKLVLQVLNDNMESQVVVKHVLAMLKAIAGNDQVKVAIVNAGGASIIIQAVSQHIKQPGVCEAGFGAIAAITLRNPSHAKIAMEAGTAPVIIQAMQIHPTEAATQKHACMALRNLVARSREYCPTILALEAEPLIQKARAFCEDEAKAALRDLGCEVELKELWKGEKNPLMR
ncbi:armadillo repeat-containing protein 6-like [Acanthaster planci]|uniref:Armadillo repeat-containing protein 6-like n=1 Tax=Acanthaster planci TaxID=133434 RepID=A0A8B7ZGK4_ACAPL|nr:armadillo repeat-containing protein 6-like [Acanthaster planci]